MTFPPALDGAVPRAGDPDALEGNDLRDLECAVERLAAEAATLRRVTTTRSVVATGVLAVLFASIATCAVACHSLAGGLVVALYLGNSLILIRACLLDVLDQERARQAAVTDRWVRDVQDRLQRTDRLLAP